MVRPLTFLMITLASSPSTGPAGAGAPEPAPGRPVVIVMHGRGVQGQDTASLRAYWRRSLDRGIAAEGGGRLLEDDDLWIVWYAEALRPDVPAFCATSATPTAAPMPREPVGEVFAAAGQLLAMGAEFVTGPEGVELRSIAGDLLYLGDDERRCAAEERLAIALARARAADRPVILLAHSFGALVSYRHLQTQGLSDDLPTVERYVTVGSLLGRPELRSLLLGRSERGRTDSASGLPPGVASWVNVRDPSDPFAAPLIGLGTGRNPAIVDRRTEWNASGDPHDLGRYLADPATASAILEVWRATAPASAGPASIPHGSTPSGAD